MNDYYSEHWKKLRKVEGASQRIQEDTMNFANMTENLGSNFVEAFMTLLAFLPILLELERFVKELPIVGAIPHPLVTAAIFWSLFGTILLWLTGIRLPGLEFNNQKVEAAYRKELVHGEDNHERAHVSTVNSLFGDVRTNYFKLYFNYLYFNAVRRVYINADNVFSYILLVPSLSAGAFSLGVFQQIGTAFGNVSGSFQYLVNSWDDIVKLISIYKRLKTFELAIDDMPLPETEVESMVT
jgi:peptide/bleomycin uptake transporter